MNAVSVLRRLLTDLALSALGDQLKSFCVLSLLSRSGFHRVSMYGLPRADSIWFGCTGFSFVPTELQERATSVSCAGGVSNNSSVSESFL